MNLGQTSLPASQRQVQHAAAFLQDQDQDQEGERKREENFIVQMLMRARKEWETFHRQHPDVDEETFCEAQRLCVKQWMLQRGIVLCSLSAFERARKYLEGEVQKCVDELDILSLMTTYTYREARALGNRMTAQAQQRSTQAHKTMIEVSSKKVSYLVDKVNRLRAPGQAQDRVKEAATRVVKVRQNIEVIKGLEIAITYEKQKEKLKEREKEVNEQLNYARQLVQESQRQSDASEYITRLENYRLTLGILLKDIYPKTIEKYDVQDAVGTMLSDWDAATQRAKDTRDQLQTFAGFVGGIQEAITAALAKTNAEVAQAKSIQKQAHRAKQTLERNRKRCVNMEKWAKNETNNIKKMQKDSEVIIKKEEKLLQAIKVTRSKTQKSMEIFENIYATLNEMKAYQVKIVQRHIKFVKSLERVKDALEQAASAAQRYAKDAKHAYDQQVRALTLPDGRAEAQKAQDQARRTLREEIEAYSSAKTFVDHAIRYAQGIASEQSNVEEQAKLLVQHFTAVLQSHLSSEKDILQNAITGVKHIVKAAMNVIKQEKRAEEAAHQIATVLETAADADPSQLIVSEQEALLLAASANDALAQSVAFYRIFHKLAADVTKECLETMKEQFVASLEVANTYLDETKQEKDEKVLQCQRAASTNAQSKAHLLVNEQTGAITFADGVTAFHLQDLAGIGEVAPEERQGQCWLLFKDGHTWSSNDVAHNLLHETTEKRTSIDFLIPDGVGGQMAILSLPNGTQIKLTDIDLGKTEYDPVKPECGVTITLKEDGGKINLLAAASVMRRFLKPEVLLELVDKSLDQNINRIRDAIGTKSLEAISGAFEDAKRDDRERKYLHMSLFSSEKVEKRAMDSIEWMESVVSASEQVVYTLRRYADEVLNDENGQKEINDKIVLKNIILDNMQGELYQKREACLQKIARGRGLDTIINCPLLKNPDDNSPVIMSPNVQEVLVEYKRARACQLAEQRQDHTGCGSSQKWTPYLGRLRRAILDEAPAYFRTTFLINQIREATENDHLEEGTPENPGVISLAKELERGLSASGGQGSQGDNDYARACEVLTQRVAAGVQKAIQTADPSDIVSRLSFLDVVFGVIAYAETQIEDALDPMTPTIVARGAVKQIGAMRSTGTKEHVMSDQRERKER